METESLTRTTIRNRGNARHDCLSCAKNIDLIGTLDGALLPSEILPGTPMAARLKRLRSHPFFLVLFAFIAHMSILTFMWVTSKTPVRDFVPYGYELGKVASSI